MYYRVIALISANIVPSLDIEGRELAYIAINILSDFRWIITLKTTFYGADFRFCIFG